MPRFSRVRRAPGRTAAVLALALLVVAGGADGGSGLAPEFELIMRQARAFGGRAVALYGKTPPADRIIWGGLIASAGLGAGVLLERLLRLRRRRVTPPDFMSRFLDRLRDGKLDSGKALDICELNSSPAARVALAAVRRWGRPVADLERAVALAARVEADRLRRNVGTLRRIAALTPLLGLLGTLLSAGRALSAIGPASTPGSWGPALGAALSPLTAGVALAILALVVYDGLAGRIETLVAALDRLGAETVDSIAMATPPEPRRGEPRQATPRGPHSIRLDTPKSATRPIEVEGDFP
jgi:biopolymer transport protein ExbB